MSPLQDGKLILLLFILYFSEAMSRTNYPCSMMVRYSTHKFERVGIIEVPFNNIKNSIKLDVRLAVRGTLPTRYVGQIEVADAENFKVPQKSKLDFKTIKFRVRFPTNKPLPLVKSISVNDKQLCDGNVDIFSYFGPVVTQIKLQYSLQFPFTSQNNTSSGDVESDEEDFNKFSVNKNCGVSNFVFGQSEVSNKKSNWPWLVTVNLKSKSSEIFLCSGSLVTAKHVITAAHCVVNHQEGDVVDESLIVYLGTINKKFKYEPGLSEYRKVSNIYINPYYEEDPFNANVAVLELSEPVPFSENIKPACLWRKIPNLSAILETDGVVALWIVDVDGSLLETSPSFIQVRIKNSEECALEERNSFYTLCTVVLSDLNWCPGAYGGELLIRQEDDYSVPKWRLRGVIQFQTLQSLLETESCSVSKKLLFTDVTMYSDWLAQILEASLF